MATPTAIHLCSGYGGFELALRSVARIRTVAHVERDAYAASILVERMGEARLDQAPVWDDLTTFDGRPWRGRVDLITAGFPCQPFSSAGRKLGTDDDRWLWPSIGRIIRDVRPRFVVLENVPQLVRLGLPPVLADLAALGFDAEWGLLSAATVGAPHKRERVWVVAHADREGLGAVGGQPDDDWDARRNPDGRDGENVGDSDGPGRAAIGRGGTGEKGVVRADSHHVTQHASENVAHAESVGSSSGQRPEARDRWPVTEAGHRFPPLRDDIDAWAEWIAEGGPEPVLRRVTDGPPCGLADALHLGGNGLVPQAASAAIRALLDRRGWEI